MCRRLQGGYLNISDWGEQVGDHRNQTNLAQMYDPAIKLVQYGLSVGFHA